jgi:hypothetical protein
MAGRPQRPIPKALPAVGRTDTLTKGAQKALGGFIDTYGQARGPGLFLRKANEQGTGNTLRQKVNSVYKRGAKVR